MVVNTLDRHRIVIALIILLGFVLRFYAANIVPLNWDEEEFFESAEKISFSPNNLHLPMIDNEYPSPIACKYLITLGRTFFGKSNLGGRLPFVTLGTFTILICYMLTKLGVGNKVALLASFLLAISQYHICSTRIADDVAPLIFFSSFSLFLFYKGLITSNKRLLLWNGLIMGIGFWFKENMFFLIPIYIIFLSIHSEFKSWLRNKYIWISFIIFLLLALPLIFLNLNQNVPRFSYIKNEMALGMSMNALGLYLGELFLLIIGHFPDFFNFVVKTMDIEYPMVNGVFGILIIIAALSSIRNRQSFIRLLVVCFLFNFIIFSFIRNKGDMGIIINTPWSLGSLDWGILSFVPGVILTANMIAILMKKYRFYGHAFFAILIFFISARTWELINFPLNCFLPNKDYCIIEWSNYAENELRTGEIERPKDLFERIYKISDTLPFYKKNASLKLADILIRETKYKEAKKYLLYILSEEPDNKEGLKLLHRLKDKNVF